MTNRFLLRLRGTAFSGNIFEFGTSIEFKKTAKSTIINYCQRVLHSKGLHWSTKIERNAREDHNQTKCQDV